MPSYISAFDCYCQNCNKHFSLNDVKISTVINLDIEGFEKDNFFNGTLNRVRCDKCLTEFAFETQLIVFSYYRHFAVYVNPNSKYDSLHGKEAPRHIYPRDFVFREVNYLIEAKEKVRIFLDGLSDLFIESIKSVHFDDTDTTPFDEINMIYTGHKDSTFFFSKFDCNDLCIGEYKITCSDIHEYKSRLTCENPEWMKVNRFTIKKLCKGE